MLGRVRGFGVLIGLGVLVGAGVLVCFGVFSSLVPYRRAGRVEDAHAVEAELSSLLAFADADHPIRVELARLGSVSP